MTNLEKLKEINSKIEELKEAKVEIEKSVLLDSNLPIIERWNLWDYNLAQTCDYITWLPSNLETVVRGYYDGDRYVTVDLLDVLETQLDDDFETVLKNPEHEDHDHYKVLAEEMMADNIKSVVLDW